MLKTDTIINGDCLEVLKVCGNYLDMNLPMANYMAKRYLTEVLENITEKQLVYPE